MAQPDLTRQHILDAALDLFAARGYHATTLPDIARAAGCSPELARGYFAGKDDLVRALYDQMAAATAAQIAQLAGGTLAARFHQVMTARLDQDAPDRDALGALLGATANPHSGVSVLGPDADAIHHTARTAFGQLVRAASDAPRAPHVETIATLLHSLHVLVLLFWLYDRSPDQRATGDLLDLIRDGLAMLRPMLVVPLVSSSLTRLAAILGAVFAPPAPSDEV